MTSRHSISTALCLALLLPTGLPQAQTAAETPAAPRAAFEPPDPVRYGVRLEMGDIGSLREWLDAGLDPDYFADRVGTGLMLAAWIGDIPMMELLVARGADVNKMNALGESALMHAAFRGHAAAVKWLFSRGAHLNGAPMRWSPLHYAAFGGHSEVALLLLENGADINARSTNGSSVLMMAVYEGHEDLAGLLLERGADRSVKNDRGDGALEWAFRYRRFGIARAIATQQEFVAAASQPVAGQPQSPRSLPAPPEGPPPASPGEPMDEKAELIERLSRMREVLAARGMAEALAKVDQRIAMLRAQRVRAERATPATVLEISASRAAPEDQKATLIPGAAPQ